MLLSDNKMSIYKFLILAFVITLSGCNKFNAIKRVESRKYLLPESVTLLKSTNYENIDELPLDHDEATIPFEGSTVRVNPENIINSYNFMNFRRNKDYLIIYENGEVHTAYSVKLNDEEGLFFISMKQFHTVFDVLTVNDIYGAEGVYKSRIKGTNLDRNKDNLNETDIVQYEGALPSQDVRALKPGRRDYRLITFEPW